MDEFGVLVESIGFKAHGKSAPMAQLKSMPQSNLTFTNGFPQNIGVPPKSDFVVDDLDGIFQTQNKTGSSFSHTSKFLDDSNDFLGVVSSGSRTTAQNQGIIDLDSVFSFSKSSYAENLNSNDDLLTSVPKKTDGIDSLLRNFVSKPDFLQRDVEDNGSNSADLIPGFGGISFSSKESNVKVYQPSSDHASYSRQSLVDDPLLVFEQSKPPADASWPFSESEPLKQDTEKSVQSSIDELERFAMGEGLKESLHQKQGKTYRESTETVTKIKKEAIVKESNLDDIFGIGTPATRIKKPISKMEDPIFDQLFKKDAEPEYERTVHRSTSPTFFPKDYSSLFEDDVNKSGEFKDIDGESDERRRRRLDTYMKTQQRMAEALAEKKQRDVQALHEQEERSRLADTLDSNVKRWAAGKEGNLRALLSSLQDVLWPECRWQTASLTDLITYEAVKKVYLRATLYLHPDKVKQKGFSPQQKYIAEKVFHVLQEAKKKIDAEELR